MVKDCWDEGCDCGWTDCIVAEAEAEEALWGRWSKEAVEAAAADESGGGGAP